MRHFVFCRALAGAGLCFQLQLSAAIVVGPGGASATFDTQPHVGEWSARSIPGNSTTFSNLTQLNEAVQALNVSSIGSVLSNSSILPPMIAPQAMWNSTAQNVQSRPTVFGALVFMARLENGTGGALSSLGVSYQFGSAYTENVNESVPGLVSYFSLTGLPGSYQMIPEFTTATPGILSATLNLGTWAHGSPLFLLWADDNGPGSAGGEAGATLEGAYTIDNFFVAVPEPSTGLLAAAGALIAFGAWRWRRRH